MNTMTIRLNLDKKGFTLIELLIALVLGLMVMAAMYEVYLIQQKSYINQQEVASIEQSLRASMFVLKREIQKAGFNPNKESGLGFIEATKVPPALAFMFAADVNNDNTISSGEREGLKFSLYTSGGVQKLGRERLDSAGNSIDKQPLAENIDALDFVFFGFDATNNPVILDDDGSGNVTTGIAGIRVVEVTIIVRASRPDINFTDTTVYKNSQGQDIFTPPANDHYRRRVLSTSVECRNMGLR